MKRKPLPQLYIVIDKCLASNVLDFVRGLAGKTNKDTFYRHKPNELTTILKAFKLKDGRWVVWVKFHRLPTDNMHRSFRMKFNIFKAINYRDIFHHWKKVRRNQKWNTTARTLTVENLIKLRAGGDGNTFKTEGQCDLPSPVPTANDK